VTIYASHLIASSYLTSGAAVVGHHPPGAPSSRRQCRQNPRWTVHLPSSTKPQSTKAAQAKSFAQRCQIRIPTTTRPRQPRSTPNLRIPRPVLCYLALYECCYGLQRAGELDSEPCHRRRHVSRPVRSDLLRSLLVRAAPSCAPRGRVRHANCLTGFSIAHGSLCGSRSPSSSASSVSKSLMLLRYRSPVSSPMRSLYTGRSPG
jgi:hypothetical protein